MNKVFIFFIIQLLGTALTAQQVDTSSPATAPSSQLLKQDSLILRAHDLVVLSKDSIESPVDYGAGGYIRFDYENKIIHLYEDAYIHYGTMDIRAAYIRVDLNQNLAMAEPKVDSVGQRTGIPEFKEGQQSFKAQRISYNFKSKKGLIEEIVTREGDLFIHGRETKFISKQSKDSGGDDIIFNQGAIITTCDAEIPHYGIFSNKQKVIPDKVAVVGPSHVQIKGIPTPLWLPFGFFPISKSARAGLIFPKEYTYDDRGFGLTNIGYYLPISDYLDLKFLGDIFFKGSFKVGVSGSYKKRYRYTGSFDLQFENRIQELPSSYLKNINRPISLRWSHNQDQGAHPYQSFGGSLNIETRGFSKLQSYNTINALQNVLRSSLNYNLQIPNSPFQFSASMAHSQNLITHQLDITLPELNLQMRSISPFKSNSRVSSGEKWFDRITLSYNARFRNSANTTDTLLFSNEIFDQLRYGFKHGAGLSGNFRILKYFNFNPSVNYDEELSFFGQNIRLLDTIYTNPGDTNPIYGKIDTTLFKRIASFRTISTSASISTQLFGQILSSKGWFRGLRHQLTPAVSFNFSPDYHKSPFSYFSKYDTDLRPEKNQPREYIRYTNSPFGPFSVPGENFNISFALSNRLELKYYSSKDSVARKIPIIENFNLAANYNVFADSFNLSMITGGGSNRLFKGIVTVYYGLALDPYGRALNGTTERRTRQFALDVNKRLFIFNSAYVNINAGSTIGQLVSLINKKAGQKASQGPPGLQDLFYDFTVQYILNFRFNRLADGTEKWERSVHSLTMQGAIPLTKKWRVNISNISFNFDNGGLQYPSLGLERDLHCWLMRFDWSPQFGYYSFFLGVKPGSLEFIRIPSNQSFTGATR